MGQVFTEIEVANYRDVILERAASLGRPEVRRVRVQRALVDTGATTLSLPSDLIAELGLPLKRRVVALTASGDIETGLYELAEIAVSGRRAVVECVELPAGSQALLGVIPLEMLGLEPDLRTRTLRVLPDDTVDTYLHV
jgi:predicted aspartyl protease